MKVQPIQNNLLAKTDQEYLDLLASDADWFIRTLEDMNSLRSANVGPFAKMTQESFDEFASSLKFSQGGLGHANYKPLMRDLSLTEIFEVFGYFGLSPIKLLDYTDMECTSPGTCSRNLFKVCTSSC